MKNGNLIVGIVVVLAVFVTGIFIYQRPGNMMPIDNQNSVIVGGDRDAHGCIGSAGYSWCEANSKCLRVWEEKCGLGSPRDATYNINGQEITLINGKSEFQVVSGSATNIKTSIFGEPVISDLNGDGIKDYVILLTQNSGGSGTFFYVATAINNKVGNIFVTNTILLGDRIAPQTTEVRGGNIIVNYADRKSNEPMTAQPSVGISRYFTVENNELREIANLAIKENSCAINGGVWYSSENICEINSLSESQCTAKGGVWNGCASPCRHDPKAEVCIMMCALTCTFK